MSEPLIFASGLIKTFGATRAVDGISLSVAPGEIYGLVGPDGAGKTTLLRLLCGVLRPNSGQAALAGFDLSRQAELAREQAGYLAQRFALYEELTVLENLRFFAEVRGIPPQQWEPLSREILAFVGLAEFTERRAGQLSGGMKQKLGLATALVHRPRVLLLDEPTTGVDPVTRQDFWQLIIRLVAREDLAVLVSTPYMDEAARCMRLGFLSHGRMLVEGTPGQLRAPLEGRVLELSGQPLDLLRREASADSDVQDTQLFGGRLHLRVVAGSTQAVMTRLRNRVGAAGGEVTSLRLITPQLEDVFIALLQGQEAQR